MLITDVSISIVFSFLCCLKRCQKKEQFRIAKIEERLGSGGFSEVLRVVGNNGRYYALKKVAGRFSKESAHQLQNEIDLLKLIQQRTSHVRYFLKTYPGDHLSDQICLLMEYLAGAQDLLEYLNEPDLYKEVERGVQLRGQDNLIFQMIASVVAVHEAGVVHRDIKLENFLFDHRSHQLKLIDFGLSDPLGTTAKVHKGTLGYFPPELLFNFVRFDVVNEKCDVWSLGVTLFFVLTNVHPFKQGVADLNQYYHGGSYSRVKRTFDSEVEKAKQKECVRALSLQLKHHSIFTVIEAMLLRDVSQRPSAAVVLQQFN